MTIFYVVATPIGNLEDITLRALRVLKEVDVILCEDTRVTKRLLEKYEIVGKQLVAYNEQKSGIAIEKIVELLEEGRNLALVSDAGTPGISDPGSYLVQKIRQALPEVKIESVPGPSALTTALSIAGIPVSDFVFLGFLPHKKGRETLFKEIAVSERAMVFYESPHRILKTLESLHQHLLSRAALDNRESKIVIARELTKIHEEVLNGTASELLEFFKNNEEKVRGEFVVVVTP
ncbi:MAG: 16S rRNA (cytidine(1402)-2'-O)-methyltransferase [bacterium]|nr:16S rRNA (cytidine(1402)-2'-O)-methyltransferase [bacterium]